MCKTCGSKYATGQCDKCITARKATEHMTLDWWLAQTAKHGAN